ncbi:glycosyltransferase [Sporosarcina sp. SG10008]|uniref:glycosyltransferase n=1 Tax=Sporosarcina sp. SG10008 TaxID=3373103 RepID=UPI0037DD9AB5
MKVLHVLHSTNIGGTERAVLNYISYNEDSTIENIVISFNGGDLDEYYMNESDFYKVTNTNSATKNFSEIYSLIKEQKIDIVYAYGLRASIIARIVSRMLKIKNIYGVRGLQNNSKGFIEILNKATMIFVDQIVTNSESVRQYLVDNHQYGVNISTIHNGTFIPIIQRNLHYEKGKILRVICVANFHLIKGHAYLIEAISNLIDKGFKLELTLLGEGNCEKEIVRQIEKLEMQNYIKLFGKVSDVYPYLYENHVLVLPSLSEGLPNAVMEAMATGLPIVCTDVGGSSELVGNMVNGLLVEPRNPKQIEEAIRYLYENPVRMRELGEKGKQIIEAEFSFAKLVSKNNGVFRRVKNR